MKLLSVRIDSAETCGGLLDSFALPFRSATDEYSAFSPLCLIGPNGAGKSQFLQVLAETFQSALHACARDEERIESNPRLEFEIEYLIRPRGTAEPQHIRIRRRSAARRKFGIEIHRWEGEDWAVCDLCQRPWRVGQFWPSRI